MGKHLAVVLKNPERIQELFGANDGNLSVFEELLGVRVYFQGNQIYLDSCEEAKRTLFERILSELEDHIALGQLPGPDLIRAVYGTLNAEKDQNSQLLKETCVVIPGGLKKVFPRSYKQALYLKAIETRDLVFSIGPAGSSFSPGPWWKPGRTWDSCPATWSRRSVPICGPSTTPWRPSSLRRLFAVWRRTGSSRLLLWPI